MSTGARSEHLFPDNRLNRWPVLPQDIRVTRGDRNEIRVFVRT